MSMSAFGPSSPPKVVPERRRERDDYPGLEELDREELDDDGAPLPPPTPGHELDWDDETDVSRVRRS
jgi:hypothetical protein